MGGRGDERRVVVMVQLAIPGVGILLGGCPGLHLWCGRKGGVGRGRRELFEGGGPSFPWDSMCCRCGPGAGGTKILVCILSWGGRSSFLWARSARVAIFFHYFQYLIACEKVGDK